MAWAKGVLVKMAYKVAAVYGTAVQAGALDGVEFVSEGITDEVDTIEDEQISGSKFQREGTAGNKVIGGPFSTALRFEGIEPIMASVMGVAAAPTVIETTAKLHKLTPHPSMEGVFGTLVIHRLVKLFEFNSFKFTGFTLKAQPGKRIILEFKGVSHDVAIGTGVNTTATFASVTFPAPRSFGQFSQMVMRVNAQAGGALAGGDAIHIAELNLSYENTVAVGDYTTQFGNRQDEPVDDGFAKVSGSVMFSKYGDTSPSNEALRAFAKDKTACKSDVVITGGLMNGITPYSWSFFLPNLQFKDGSPVAGGPSKVPLTLNFQGWRTPAGVAPTGFDALYVDALAVAIASLRSTGALS